MATTKKATRGRKPQKGQRSKKSVVFEVLDQSPGISTEDALAALRKRKVHMEKGAFYSVRTLWNAERGKGRAGKRTRQVESVEPDSGIPPELELQLLRAENDRLKAAMAILLG